MCWEDRDGDENEARAGGEKRLASFVSVSIGTPEVAISK